MAHRKEDLGRDAEGRFRRYLGWKQGNGKLIQHLFRLGRDRDEAVRRNARLEALWGCVETRWRRLGEEGRTSDPVALWDDVTLAIGASVAKGDSVHTVALPPEVERMGAEGQLFWLYNLQRDYPGFALRLPDEAKVKAAADGLVLKAEVIEQQAEFAENVAAHTQGHANFLREVAGVPSAPVTSQMLHQALDAFSAHIGQTHQTLDKRPSPTCLLHQRQVRQIKAHQADMPLSAFGLVEIEALVNHWRNRPVTQRGTPAAVETVRDVIKRVKEFVRWLHRSPSFSWRKPEDLEWGRIRIPRAPVEIDGPDEVQTYTIGQLETLYEYASPFERLLMLLGLNCGFGQAEILTLQRRSIKGEFIRRRRFKTGVYGEWKLWDVTRAGIVWMLARHKGENASLLVTRDGTAIEYTTDSGNRAQHIANAWTGLTRRIRKKDHPQFPILSFNKLRKTAATLIRQIAGGEVAGLFLCHGQVVSDDLLEEYAARHFPPVHSAIDTMAGKLAGMFAKVADPFPTDGRKSNPSVSLGTIKRMREMKAQGMTVQKIAVECGVCDDTVRRYLKKSPA